MAPPTGPAPHSDHAHSRPTGPPLGLAPPQHRPPVPRPTHQAPATPPGHAPPHGSGRHTDHRPARPSLPPWEVCHSFPVTG